LDTHGNDFACNGSEEPPWANIAQALEQLTNGDTLVIGAGTFTVQSLAVRKSITILGTGAGFTCIQASETKPAEGSV
jgi:hypothetical protein